MVYRLISLANDYSLIDDEPVEPEGPEEPVGKPEPSPDIEAELVSELASMAHDDWRAPRQLEGGEYDPRIKKTTDEAWIEAHGGQTEVDIANTPYAELPADWQAENKASAEVAVKATLQAQSAGRPLDDALVDEIASDLHDAWLQRNSWAKGGELDKPYLELPEDEKEKDRIFVKRAIELLQAKTGEIG